MNNMPQRSTPRRAPVSAKQLERRLDGLARLLEVSRSLAAEIDLTKILTTITAEACRALNCERASLYQYDPEHDELYTAVVTELELSEIRKKADQGISGYVARNRTVANVADPQSDPRWNPAFDAATGYHTRSILAAPLTTPRDGSLLGVIELLNKHGGPFDTVDEQLLEAFGQHAAVALDRTRLVDELRRQHLVEASLDVARQIQRGFMPQKLPEVAGYELASWWFPNEAVGGDYCDVLPLTDGRTGLVIADVSGHGLGPSLLMASVRAALRALLIDHAATEVLLGLLGRALAADLQEGRFITILLAALDPAAHRVEYANAGHAPAMHYVAGSRTFVPLESTGMPLGVLDRPEYPQGPTVRMAVGDLLVLCTDGIVEAMNAESERFGQARLEDIVRRMATRPIVELVGQIGAEVESHYDGASPPDDLTILALRRNE